VALVGTVAVTTVVWVAVAFMTAPTDADVLRSFYRAVRPAGPGWAPVRRACGRLPPIDALAPAFTGWVSGCACVYGALFGTGHALLGHPIRAAVCGVLCIASGAVMVRVFRRLWA
jgi:solute:Na+ symporter, SSS family